MEAIYTQQERKLLLCHSYASNWIFQSLPKGSHLVSFGAAELLKYFFFFANHVFHCENSRYNIDII